LFVQHQQELVVGGETREGLVDGEDGVVIAGGDELPAR
jgi:hypothetical protein